jgi:hypothetical protein
LHAHCLFIQLEPKYAKQTDSLVLPHRYVPWVVVDGQPLLEVSTKIPSKVTCAIFGSFRLSQLFISEPWKFFTYDERFRFRTTRTLRLTFARPTRAVLRRFARALQGSRSRWRRAAVSVTTSMRSTSTSSLSSVKAERVRFGWEMLAIDRERYLHLDHVNLGQFHVYCP